MCFRFPSAVHKERLVLDKNSARLHWLRQKNVHALDQAIDSQGQNLKVDGASRKLISKYEFRAN